MDTIFRNLDTLSLEVPFQRSGAGTLKKFDTTHALFSDLKYIKCWQKSSKADNMPTFYNITYFTLFLLPFFILNPWRLGDFHF